MATVTRATHRNVGMNGEMSQCEAKLPLVSTVEGDGGVMVRVGEEGEVFQGGEGGGVSCAIVVTDV